MKKNNLILALVTLMMLLNACSEQTESATGPKSGLSATNTSPAWTIDDVPVSPAVAMANRYPKVEASFPGGVTGLQDLVYLQIPGYRPLRLDMYLPSDTGTTHPMVMYIHGGGWRNGHSQADPRRLLQVSPWG